MRRRSKNYWGITEVALDLFEIYLKQHAYDAVIGVGVETLPFLSRVTESKRVWYPADDPALYYWTIMRRTGFSVRGFRFMLSMYLYERAYRTVVDLCWVVSQRDRDWMARTMGQSIVHVISNGVDFEYFSSKGGVSCNEPACAFWGRLDFPPNEHALDYFLNKVWPQVKIRVPTAQFHICGVSPSSKLRSLMAGSVGVTFHEDADDLRPIIGKCRLAVFPMVSGAGVKNKVLEAAAMEKAIVATNVCRSGLNGFPPFAYADSAGEFAEAIVKLFQQPEAAMAMGNQSRAWVIQNHSWRQTAESALASLAR